MDDKLNLSIDTFRYKQLVVRLLIRDFTYFSMKQLSWKLFWNSFSKYFLPNYSFWNLFGNDLKTVLANLFFDSMIINLSNFDSSNLKSLKHSILTRWHQGQGSTDRQIGPRFSKFCWSWSDSVRDFPNFVGPGPVQSEIF